MKRIAFRCADEMVQDFRAALDGYESEFAGVSASLFESLEICDGNGFDCFVIMDESASDEEIVSAAARYLAGAANMEIIFVANGFRSCPSPFFNKLIDAGVTQIVAKIGGGAYPYFDRLVELIENPISIEDARAYAIPEAEHRVVASEQRNLVTPKRPAAATRQSEPFVDDRVMKSIGIASSYIHEGATHTALSMARALKICGKRVALVVSRDHFEEFMLAYPNAPKDPERGAIGVRGIHIYCGNRAADVPDGYYDYVIVDFGEAMWLYPEEDEVEEATKLYNAFYACDMKIFSSFFSATGEWGAGRKTLQMMSKPDRSKLHVAVFGAPSDEVYDKLEEWLSFLSPHARLHRIAFLPNPLGMADANDVPEHVWELLGFVLNRHTIASVRRKANPSAEGTELEVSEQAADDSQQKQKRFWHGKN